jgi:hypothetical protein
MTQPERDIDESTREAEETEATASHQADRAASEDEVAAAERAADDPSLSGHRAEVAAHEQDMARRGVEAEGEGRID